MNKNNRSNKLNKKAIAWKLLTSFLITIALFTSCGQVEASEAEGVIKATNNEVTKTFDVMLDGKEFILAIGQEDFYSFIPKAIAKELNIEANGVYEVYYTTKEFKVFASVNYSSKVFKDDEKVKALKSIDYNFTEENIEATIKAETGNSYAWSLGLKTYEKVVAI